MEDTSLAFMTVQPDTVVWARIEPWPNWPALVVSRKWAEQQISPELRDQLPEESTRNCTVMFFNYGNFIDVVDTVNVHEFCEHVYLLGLAGTFENNVKSAAQEAIWWLLGSGKTTRAQQIAVADFDFRQIILEAGLRFETKSPVSASGECTGDKQNSLSIDLLQIELTSSEKERSGSLPVVTKRVSSKRLNREAKPSENAKGSSCRNGSPINELTGFRSCPSQIASKFVEPVRKLSPEHSLEEGLVRQREEKQAEEPICEISTDKNPKGVYCNTSAENRSTELNFEKSAVMEEEGVNHVTCEEELNNRNQGREARMEFEGSRKSIDRINTERKSEVSKHEKKLFQPTHESNVESTKVKRLARKPVESLSERRKLLKPEELDHGEEPKKKCDGLSGGQVIVQKNRISIRRKPINMERHEKKRKGRALQPNESDTSLPGLSNLIQPSLIPDSQACCFENQKSQLKNYRSTAPPKRKEVEKRKVNPKIRKNVKNSAGVLKRSCRNFRSRRDESHLSCPEEICGTIRPSPSLGFLNFKMMQMSNSLTELQRVSEKLKDVRQRIEVLEQQIRGVQHQLKKVRKLSRQKRKRVKILDRF